MTKNDLPSVIALERECFTDPWSEFSFMGSLQSAVSLCLVAEENGSILGYAVFTVIADEAEVLNIAVSPALRKHGIAKEMLNTFYSSFKGTTFLEVRKNNLAAISLYEKFGFVAFGVRPDYYTRPTEDAVLMKKEDTI